MKIAIVGNSHISAFSEGWPTIRDRHPDVELTFFGAIKGEIEKLVVENGQLRARRPRAIEWLKMTSGQEAIPGTFDRYIVLGLGFGSFFFVQLLRKHRLFDVPSEASSLVSRSFVTAAADSVADISSAHATFRNLRSITASPITVLPCPHVSEGARDLPNFDVMRNDAVMDEAMRLYRRQLDRLDWDMIEQPASTLAGAAFTQARFTRGASHFLPDETLKDHDVNHMNGDFGALYLDEVLSSFR